MNFKGKHGPLLIAEIGGNHEGDFEYAKRLVRLAIESNVDYIKLQAYTGDSIVSKIESKDRNQHFKKFELTLNQYIELGNLISQSGIGFMASIWNFDWVDSLDASIGIYKIGSGDLTNFPLLEYIAKKGKPIILSTGLSFLYEVIQTVTFIQEINPIYKDANYLAVLQCTSMYPIPDADANLSVMKKLKEGTSLTVGYSDHTEGLNALKYAVALGAEILEFHFTDTRENKVFRDHKVSLTKEEVFNLINEIKLIDTLMGNDDKKPLPIEIENGHVISFRRGLYASKDLSKGTILTGNDISALRPCVGIDAREYRSVVGKKLMVDLKEFEKLEWKFLE